MGVLSAVSAASEIPILLVSSKLVRRFGEMNLLIFSCFMAALRLVLVGTGIVPVMVCGQLLQSVSYMTVYYSCVTYIANHTYEDCRARGPSWLRTCLAVGRAMRSARTRVSWPSPSLQRLLQSLLLWRTCYGVEARRRSLRARRPHRLHRASQAPACLALRFVFNQLTS